MTRALTRAHGRRLAAKRSLLAAFATVATMTSLVGGASVAGGCKSLQKAAGEDPLKCERDAKCDKKRGRTMDCSMQCNDDPACMSRCEQVQAPTGPLGH